MPVRAPASIARLHSVRRPSIVSARIARPAYSTAWPCAPLVPILAMIESAMSFAPMPGPHLPSTVTRMRFGFFCQKVCVSITCETSDAPMPIAIAPSAPCVAVWLSPHTITQARNGQPLLRPDHVHDALARVVEAHQHDAVLAACSRRSARTMLASEGSAIGLLRACVGT